MLLREGEKKIAKRGKVSKEGKGSNGGGDTRYLVKMISPSIEKGGGEGVPGR